MACNNRHGEWNQSRYHKHPDLVIERQTGSIIFRDPQSMPMSEINQIAHRRRSVSIDHRYQMVLEGSAVRGQ